MLNNFDLPLRIIIIAGFFASFPSMIMCDTKNALFPRSGNFSNIEIEKIIEGETICKLGIYEKYSPVKAVADGKGRDQVDKMTLELTFLLASKSKEVTASDVCWGFGGPFECKKDLADDPSIYTCQCATSNLLADLKLFKRNDHCQSDLGGLCIEQVQGSVCKPPLACDSSEKDSEPFDMEFNGKCSSLYDDAENLSGNKAENLNGVTTLHYRCNSDRCYFTTLMTILILFLGHRKWSFRT